MSNSVLVTGGGNGIGAGISAGLARQGDSVIVWERDAGTAAIAAERFAADGLRIDCRAVDVSDPAAVDAGMGDVGDGLDVLVNCAAVTGIPAKVAFADTTPEVLARIMGVNAFGPFYCARAAAGLLAARGGGVIVNVGSIAAYRAQIDAAAYTMSKAAVTGLTRALALELAEQGTRVVQVDPGDIATDASDRLIAMVDDGRARAGISDLQPVGRRGTPADIAATVRFLCSPEAGFISGSQIVVDGGYLAG